MSTLHGNEDDSRLFIDNELPASIDLEPYPLGADGWPSAEGVVDEKTLQTFALAIQAYLLEEPTSTPEDTHALLVEAMDRLDTLYSLIYEQDCVIVEGLVRVPNISPSGMVTGYHEEFGMITGYQGLGFHWMPQPNILVAEEGELQAELPRLQLGYMIDMQDERTGIGPFGKFSIKPAAFAPVEYARVERQITHLARKEQEARGAFSEDDEMIYAIDSCFGDAGPNLQLLSTIFLQAENQTLPSEQTIDKYLAYLHARTLWIDKGIELMASEATIIASCDGDTTPQEDIREPSLYQGIFYEFYMGTASVEATSETAPAIRELCLVVSVPTSHAKSNYAIIPARATDSYSIGSV